MNSLINVATSATVKGEASYKLIKIDGGAQVLTGNAGAAAAYDRSLQRYNDLRAERDAEIRLARALRRRDFAARSPRRSRRKLLVRTLLSAAQAHASAQPRCFSTPPADWRFSFAATLLDRVADRVRGHEYPARQRRPDDAGADRDARGGRRAPAQARPRSAGADPLRALDRRRAARRSRPLLRLWLADRAA